MIAAESLHLCENVKPWSECGLVVGSVERYRPSGQLQLVMSLVSMLPALSRTRGRIIATLFSEKHLPDLGAL